MQETQHLRCKRAARGAVAVELRQIMVPSAAVLDLCLSLRWTASSSLLHPRFRQTFHDCTHGVCVLVYGRLEAQLGRSATVHTPRAAGLVR